MNFKQYLKEEAFVSKNRYDKDTDLKLRELNKNRIGQTVINVDGKEINNSKVLSLGTYAEKVGKDTRIEVFDKLMMVNYTVVLSPDEIKILSKM